MFGRSRPVESIRYRIYKIIQYDTVCEPSFEVVKLVRLLKDTTWAEESPFQFFIMGATRF